MLNISVAYFICNVTTGHSFINSILQIVYIIHDEENATRKTEFEFLLNRLLSGKLGTIDCHFFYRVTDKKSILGKKKATIKIAHNMMRSILYIEN